MSATAPSDLIALHDEIKSHKRKAIIHYHLHKTGGTTIKRVFHENFKDSSIKVDSLAELGEFEKRFADGLFDEEKTYFIHGHRSKSVAAIVKETLPTYGFTILRRPFGMFESNFSYQHTRHGRDDLTSKDYLEEYTKNIILNYFDFPNLAVALEETKDTFNYVGITERLEESLAILKYLFDLEDKPYPSRNVTKSNDYAQVDTSIVTRFAAKHLDDIMFYEQMMAEHAKTYREFENADLGKTAVLKMVKGSYHKPVKVDLDIENNKDKVSLFMSGREVYRKDTPKALSFFTKSFEADWNMADRIIKFLFNKDEAVAKKWVEERIEFLKKSDTTANVNMVRRLQGKLKEAQA